MLMVLADLELVSRYLLLTGVSRLYEHSILVVVDMSERLYIQGHIGKLAYR